MRRLTRTPIHPLFIALYPATALLASNMGQVKPSIAGRAGLVALLLAGSLLLLTRVASRNWATAAFLTTWWLALFFSYGHVYNMLRGLETSGPSLGRHRFMVPTWLIFGGFGVWVVLRVPDLPIRIIPALNLALGVALILPIGEILSFQREAAARAEGSQRRGEIADLSSHAGDRLPDIYFIILDAYTSSVALRDSFGQDNGPFLASLRELGFSVAECSQSNYSQTELSLAATMNLAYLETLVDESLEGDEARRQLWPLIRHSELRRLLEEIGYQTVAFETGYYWSELEDADLYLAPEPGLLRGLSAFEATLLRSTAAWALVDILPGLPGFLLRDLDRSADAHRGRLLYVFDELERLGEVPGPKFAFAHIVSPHRPFVFDSEGNLVEDDYGWQESDLGLEAYRAGYWEQVQYLNRRVLSALHEILTDSSQPPIIVVQGDHGPEEGSSDDRMQILSVIYFGGRDLEVDPSKLTPVNTFRLVFSEFFGADLPPIEDVSYFSTYDAPFDYSIVPNRCLAQSDP